MKEVEKITPYATADKSKKGQVEDMFDNIAHNYDFLNRLLSMRIDVMWRNQAVKLLKKHKSDDILDVATGTGDFAIALRKLEPKRIVGCDISEGMMSIGREKVQAKGLDQLISFQRGDSENLPFESNSFDVITVAYGVRNFENIDQGLAEMNRVLRPGGILVVLELSKPRVFPVKQIFNIYFKFILPIIGKTFSKDHRAYTYLPESVESFPEGEEFLQLLGKAGFTNTIWKPQTFGISSLYTGIK